MANRVLSLDLIKLVAMFGVICLHSEMSFYDNPIAQFLYMTAVVSIPLFFITSGYLLYAKQNVDYKYSCRKILGILKFVAIITITFWLILGLRHGEPFWESTLGCLLQYGRMGIFWYFGAMIILYALFPVLHLLYVKCPKQFLGLTILLLFIANGIFIANFFGYYIENDTIQTFRLWNWIFYFNIGGIIRKYQPKAHWWQVILLLIANYIFQYEVTPLMPTLYCEYFYSSIIVMLLSSVLFSWLLSINDNKLKLINRGAILFLPVYTFHPIIIGKILGLFNLYVYSINSYTAPLFWVIVSVLSVLISILVLKIPYMP